MPRFLSRPTVKPCTFRGRVAASNGLSSKALADALRIDPNCIALRWSFQSIVVQSEVLTICPVRSSRP